MESVAFSQNPNNNNSTSPTATQQRQSQNTNRHSFFGGTRQTPDEGNVQAQRQQNYLNTVNYDFNTWNAWENSTGLTVGDVLSNTPAPASISTAQNEHPLLYSKVLNFLENHPDVANFFEQHDTFLQSTNHVLSSISSNPIVSSFYQDSLEANNNLQWNLSHGFYGYAAWDIVSPELQFAAMDFGVGFAAPFVKPFMNAASYSLIGTSLDSLSIGVRASSASLFLGTKAGQLIQRVGFWGKASQVGAEDGEITLFRSVSHDELNQIINTKQFAQGPNSLEGKFFAENFDDAQKWGDIMNGVGNHTVIEVHVPTAIAKDMMRWPKLDGIGPARYGTIEQLENVKISTPEITAQNVFNP